MTTRKEFVADVLARIGALAIDHEVRRLGGFDAPALTEHPALNHVEVAILLRSAEAVADGLDTAGLLEDEEPRGFHPELREDAAVDEAGQNIRHKEAYVEGLRNRFGESMAPFLNAGGMSACIQKFRESFVAGTVEHVVGLFLEHLEAEVFHLALRADVLQEERAAARGTVSSLRHEVQGLLRAAEVNRNRLADAEAAVSALEDAIDAHRGARRAEDDGSLDTAAAADLALYAVLEAGEAKAAVSLAGAVGGCGMFDEDMPEEEAGLCQIEFAGKEVMRGERAASRCVLPAGHLGPHSSTCETANSKEHETEEAPARVCERCHEELWPPCVVFTAPGGGYLCAECADGGAEPPEEAKQ